MTERFPFLPAPERSEPLPKTADFIYAYRGIHDRTAQGRCRVRIFERGSETPVILCTELPDNPSTSITNMAEILAAEVIAQQLPQRFDYEEPGLWLEHYPPVPGARAGPHAQPRVDRVTFASWTPRKIWLGGQARISLGEPDWNAVPLAAVAALLGENELNDPLEQLP